MAKDPAAILQQGSSDSLAADSGYHIKVGGVYNTSLPSPTNGQRCDFQVDNQGRLIVAASISGSTGNTAASATGSAVPANADYGGINVGGTLRGQTGVNPSGSVYATQMDVTSFGGTTVVTGVGASGAGIPRVTVSNDSTIGLVPNTTGGLTIYRNINLGTTGVSVKGSPGQVYGWYIANNAAYAIFVKLYNKASAPTVGTDVPVMTLEIPAGSAANVNFAQGIAFATGIGIGASKLVADADATALSANDCVCNLLYN
jgi:hypothetical protein